MANDEFKNRTENPQNKGIPPPEVVGGKKPNGEAPDEEFGPATAVDAAEEAEPSYPSSEQLDEEEREYRRLTRSLPNVQGAAAAGIIVISVGKAPDKNEFYRHEESLLPRRRHGQRNDRDGE
jgi:hypothetical protein